MATKPNLKKYIQNKQKMLRKGDLPILKMHKTKIAQGNIFHSIYHATYTAAILS